jgi:APA family basic amino acid/polyamine antiporter
MVVGIMVGSGIFRTPGLVARDLGRPGLVLLIWVLGGALAFVGALLFAELATRLPRAGGKYVYAREAFGPRAGFVVGWVEGLGIYPTAIAAIAVVCGEYLGRMGGWADGEAGAAFARLAGVGFVALFTAINLIGVASGRWVQNVVTAAKVLALGGVVVIALAAGTGAGWHGALPDAPEGLAVWVALAVAFQAVIWTYYGYADAAKIAEEVIEPQRTLPRVLLGGITLVTTLYLLLNAAFLHVLPLDRLAASNLTAGDVADAIFGAAGAMILAVIALLVVLASLNGNVFVTPRVLFGLARDGLGPASLARVNRGGTPWAAMLAVGVVAAGLAATGTFEKLLGLAIALVLLIDGFAVVALFPLRARAADAPFHAPLGAFLPAAFIGIYAALLVGMAIASWQTVAIAAGVLGAAYVLGKREAGSGKRD